MKKIGLVFQDPDLQIVGETVEKDIEFGLRNLNLTSVEIERKVNKVINELKLIDLRNRDPLTLSGGEKRKLILADILVMDPDIIILDEIFANPEVMLGWLPQTQTEGEEKDDRLHVVA